MIKKVLKTIGKGWAEGENKQMGMYTEVNVCFDLVKDTLKDIIDILYYLIEGKDEPLELPNHDFFKCDRWDMVARCDSYYFD